MCCAADTAEAASCADRGRSCQPGSCDGKCPPLGRSRLFDILHRNARHFQHPKRTCMFKLLQKQNAGSCRARTKMSCYSFLSSMQAVLVFHNNGRAWGRSCTLGSSSTRTAGHLKRARTLVLKNSVLAQTIDVAALQGQQVCFGPNTRAFAALVFV